MVSGRNLNSSKLSCMSLSPARKKMIQSKTTIVRVSAYSPTIALSEDKDIFRSMTLFEKLMAGNNPDVDLINGNVHTKFG